jgi:hypothetical protein
LHFVKLMIEPVDQVYGVVCSCTVVNVSCDSVKEVYSVLCSVNWSLVKVGSVVR